MTDHALARRYIAHDPEHRLIFCISCKEALLPSASTNHIQHHHKTWSSNTRAAIQAFIESIAADVINSRAYVVLPSKPIYALPHLQTVQALQCTVCPKVLADRDQAKGNIYRHQRTDHAEWLAGGPTVPRSQPVYAQRFFPSGGANPPGCQAASYFPVLLPDEAPPTESTLVPDTPPNGLKKKRSFADAELEPSEFLAALSRDAQNARNEIQAKLLIVPEIGMEALNAFVSESGWDAVYANKRTDQIVPLWEAPAHPVSEVRLVRLESAVHAMAQKLNANIGHLAIIERREVLREDSRAPIPVDPIHPYNDPKVKHAMCIRHLFRYLARTQDLDEQSPLPVWPAYQLEEKQQQAWRRICALLREPTHKGDEVRAFTPVPFQDLTRLERACHKMLMALFMDRTSQPGVRYVLTDMLGALCLKGAGGWIDVGNASTMLSEMKKWGRFALLHYHVEYSSHLHREAADAAVSGARDTTDADPGEVAFAELRHLVQRYFSTNMASPMYTIIYLAQLANRCARSSRLQEEGCVVWNNGDLTIGPHHINVVQFRNMVWGVYQQTRAKLLEALFYDGSDSGQPPPIPWEDLRDAPGHSQLGHCTFSPQNEHLQHGQGFLERRVAALYGDPVSRARWRRVLPLDVESCGRYNQVVRELELLLLLLVHLVYGQPARATELTSIRYANSTENGLRNVFLIQGLVAIVSSYHKGYSASHQAKVVFRFLPREVGSLLVWYLWLVLPYYHTVQATMQRYDEEAQTDKERAQSFLLWPRDDGTWDKRSSTLTNLLRTSTRQHLDGTCFGIRAHRHAVIAIGRRVIGEGGFMDIVDERDLDARREDVDNDALEEQAGHSAFIGRTVYAKLLETLFSAQSRLQERQYNISTRWHRFLQFELVDQQLPGHRVGMAASRDALAWMNQDPVASQVTEQRAQWVAQHAGVDLMPLLRHATDNPMAVFRRSQEQALRAVFQDHSIVAYVAGTGQGKSLLFLLPAWYHHYGLTIVVVPLIALREDLMRRARQWRLPCAAWDPVHPREDVSLLFAMPEHLHHDAFRSFVRRTFALGRLRRIVLDECHTVLSARDGFRVPAMERLREVVRFQVPLTLLSATIPPSEESTIWRDLGLGKEKPLLVRESTNRPHVRYEVDNTSVFVGAEDVARYIDGQRRAHPQQKMLVFLNHKDLLDDTAARLGCGRYHRGLDADVRAAQLAHFANDPDAVLLATDAASHGLDLPDLDVVLVLGTPKTLRDLAQQAGRAGRANQRTVVRVWYGAGLPAFSSESGPARRWVHLFLGQKRPQCRRAVLEAYLDGRVQLDGSPERTHCTDEEFACDVCDPGLADAPLSTASPATASPVMATPCVRPTSRAVLADPALLDEALFDDDDALFEDLAQEPVGAYSRSSGAVYGTPTPAAPRRGPGPSRTHPSPHPLASPAPSPRLGAHRAALPLKSPLGATSCSPSPRFRLASATDSPQRTPQSRQRTPQPPQTAPPPTRPKRSHPPPRTYSSPMAATAFVADRARHLLQLRDIPPPPPGDTATKTMEDVRQLLRFWSSHCIVCYLADPSDFHHARSGCRATASHLQTSLIKKRLDFRNNQSGNVCWACWLPGGACDNFEWGPNGWTWKKYNSQCPNKHILPDVFASLWAEPSGVTRLLLEEHMQAQKGPSSLSDVQFGPWQSSFVNLGDGTRVVRAIAELLWITEQKWLGAPE